MLKYKEPFGKWHHLHVFSPSLFFVEEFNLSDGKGKIFFENRKTGEGKLYSTLKFSEITSMLMIFQHSKAKTN